MSVLVFPVPDMGSAFVKGKAKALVRQMRLVPKGRSAFW
jgi:hypothetical protein